MYALTVTVFFFLRYLELRYLHSFPTRRSSDLFYRLSALPAGTYLLTVSAKNFANSTFENVELTVNRTVALRSEEHTSELQSRFDLVCRLLLEKKKEYTTTDVRVMNWNGLRSCT